MTENSESFEMEMVNRPELILCYLHFIMKESKLEEIMLGRAFMGTHQMRRSFSTD